MVLERLFSVDSLLKSPYTMFLYGFLIVVVSFLSAYIFFTKSASILVIAFITIAFTHFIHKVIELIDLNVEKHTNIYFRYEDLIKTYLKIFGALTVAFAFLYVILPSSFANILFSEQMATMNSVSQIKDTILASKGYFFLSFFNGLYIDLFLLILLNNLEVLFAMILLSFLYGVGSIFLIAYQSSILGFIIGQNVLNLMSNYANLGIYGQLFAILYGAYLSLGFLPHGIFEIGAYFLGAIAGGVISFALISKSYINYNHLYIIVKDVFVLVIASILFLVIGAFIESFLIIM